MFWSSYYLIYDIFSEVVIQNFLICQFVYMTFISEKARDYQAWCRHGMGEGHGTIVLSPPGRFVGKKVWTELMVKYYAKQNESFV